MTDPGRFAARTDGGWPEHEVKNFEPIGRPLSVPTRAIDENLREELEAVEGANSYLVLEVQDWRVRVQFGRAVVDGTMRVPSQDELTSDWSIRERATRQMAEAWWRERCLAEQV